MPEHPAIGGIIAKIMALVEIVLDQFVDLYYLTNYDPACNIPIYYAHVNGCGEALADEVAQLVYSAATMINQLVAGLVALLPTPAPSP